MQLKVLVWWSDPEPTDTKAGSAGTSRTAQPTLGNVSYVNTESCTELSTVLDRMISAWIIRCWRNQALVALVVGHGAMAVSIQLSIQSGARPQGDEAGDRRRAHQPAHQSGQ